MSTLIVCTPLASSKLEEIHSFLPLRIVTLRAVLVLTSIVALGFDGLRA
jgi:hypothetical protein